MPIRLSGINSGLDTESLVKELVSAYSIKKQKYDKQLTKQEWSMNKWSEVNSKVYGFYTSTLSSLKFSSGYNLKTSSVSRTGVATVTASSNAVTSTQTLSVSQLATSGYMTGGTIKMDDNSKPKADTKLSELGLSDGTIMVGDKKVEVKADMSLDAFATSLKGQGINASYDATTGRMFVSSSSSGSDKEFTLTAGDASGFATLQKLGLMSVTDLEGKETAEVARYREIAAGSYDAAGAIDSKYNSSKWTVESYTNKLQSDVSTANKNKEALEKSQEKLIEKQEKLNASEYKWEDDYKTEEEFNKAKEDIAKSIEDNAKQIEEYQTIIDEKQGLLDSDSALSAKVDELNNDIYNNIQSDVNSEVAIAREIVAKIDAGEIKNSADSARITAKDAKITLNGAEFTSSTNSFSINGLNINVTATTTSSTTDESGNEIIKDDPVTISTAVDTQGIYDKIKGMFDKYNELSTYLNGLYYADSASGYEPLTDDEKEAMTDKQVEDWEKKIKDALLRKDSTIGSLTSAMKTAILSTKVMVGGKELNIASFGIASQSYFSAKNEDRGNFHIDGNKDDPVSSANADKLMAAISADPEGTVKFFQTLAANLYDEIGKKMSSSTLSSAFTIYNDKEMSSQYSDYKTKVSDWEKKLKDYEDSYYKKFSAMEKAMATLQSQQSQLAGLLGG